MKLLHKTTRDYLIASVSILVITGLALFLILRKEVSDEMDEQLELQADELFADAGAGKLINTPFVKIYPAPAGSEPGRIFGDSMIFDRIQHMVEEYHYLIETRDVGKVRYQAVTMTSHIGWDRYYLTIFYIFVVTALLLTVSGVAINYLSNRKIWAPFFENLSNVRDFSVTSPDDLKLLDSPIDEFTVLNKTFSDLARRSRKEYLALREFTENASHEIQTPLSIVQSKLDRISQMEINEEMAAFIVQAQYGVERLSKMNRNLLLLAKLENKAFTNFGPIALEIVISDQLAHMEELFATRHINITHELEPTEVQGDDYLAETLVSNLLSNTLRYTPANGSAKVRLVNKLLTVSNTGPEPDFAPELIFDRFVKGQSNTASTGLGLAIARQICQTHQWKINYRYESGQNIFDVEFG